MGNDGIREWELTEAEKDWYRRYYGVGAPEDDDASR